MVVHPVIATTNRAHLADPPDEGRTAAALIRNVAIEVMSAALVNLDEERAADWPDFLALGPHLHAMFSTAAPHADRPHLCALVTITTYAAGAHVLAGAIPVGERLAAAAVSMAGRLGDDDPVTLRARHELAWCMAMQGHYQPAEVMFHDTLAGFRKTVGRYHRHTLNAHNEVAWIAACQQRWAEAEATYRQVLADRIHVLGDSDPETLITHHELGWTLANQGRTREAAAILQEVLLARRERLGDHHQRTIMTRHELAWVTARLGSYPQAETAYRQIIQSCLEVLGHEHPRTLTVQHELGWVLALAGKRRAALAQYRSVLSARTQVLGNTHPDTADTRNALTSLRNGTVITPHHIA